MKKTYCVIYRTGGTENFQWRRTLPVTDREMAQRQQLEMVRAGYHSFVEDYQKSVSVGLPDTYGREG